MTKEYTRKGDLVLVEGKLKQERWETQEGQRSCLKVYGDKIKFFAKTSETSENASKIVGNGSVTNYPSQDQNAAQSADPVPSYGRWTPPTKSPKVWEVNPNDDPAELEGLRDVSEEDLDIPF